jgi:AcrR family transcriptional regulator
LKINSAALEDDIKNLRKSEIIEKAAECFMEKGYQATSVDDVARRLGCTKGKVYYYYATKTDLFLDVHREGMARLFGAVEPAARSGGDSLAVLAAMLLAHAQAMLEHQTYETVVAQGVQVHRYASTTAEQRAALDEQIASRDRFENLFKRQAELARRDGTLGKIDVSVAVKMMLGALQWSIIWYRPEADKGPQARKRLAEKMVKPLIEGLKTRELR